MKVAVLYGGYSPEREVSLVSGRCVASALRKKGHAVCLLDSYLGCEKADDSVFTTEDIPDTTPIQSEPNLALLRRKSGNGKSLIGKNVIEICRMADKVFLALHGGMGEDGRMQALLGSFGIPYTGSGVLGSALAMNKQKAKIVLKEAGVPVPFGISSADYETTEEFLFACEEKVGFPMVIKPCDAGSSVGVSMVEKREQLADAVDLAYPYGEILCEKRIVGRELTQPIVRDVAYPPVEIIPNDGFYDYENKYSGKTREECPAKIPADVAERMAEYAKKGFQALHLCDYARFDFLLDTENRLYCLEANTLPGMTPQSLLPLSAKTAGVDYETLCEIILGD